MELLDGDYVLTEGAAWFTVGEFSIRLHKDLEGVAVDIYKLGAEYDSPLGSTWVSAYAAVTFIPRHRLEDTHGT